MKIGAHWSIRWKSQWLNIQWLNRKKKDKKIQISKQPDGRRRWRWMWLLLALTLALFGCRAIFNGQGLSERSLFETDRCEEIEQQPTQRWEVALGSSDLICMRTNGYGCLVGRPLVWMYLHKKLVFSCGRVTNRLAGGWPMALTTPVKVAFAALSAAIKLRSSKQRRAAANRPSAPIKETVGSAVDRQHQLSTSSTQSSHLNSQPLQFHHEQALDGKFHSVVPTTYECLSNSWRSHRLTQIVLLFVAVSVCLSLAAQQDEIQNDRDLTTAQQYYVFGNLRTGRRFRYAYGAFPFAGYRSYRPLGNTFPWKQIPLSQNCFNFTEILTHFMLRRKRRMWRTKLRIVYHSFIVEAPSQPVFKYKTQKKEIGIYIF